jgi:hypothetical protein
MQVDRAGDARQRRQHRDRQQAAEPGQVSDARVKSRPMVGRAMLTTVASSAAIPEPSTVMASTHRPGVEE